VPFHRRPMAMWKSLESCRSVTLPQLSTLSVRTRKCVSATGSPGRAFSKASKADFGVTKPRGPVGTFLVVDVHEAVDLTLEFGHRTGRLLLGQVALDGLVEALDLAAGLGVIGLECFITMPSSRSSASKAVVPFRGLPLKMAPLSVSTEPG
jgi:hypothetical protein